MGWATQRGPRPRLVATSHRLASYVIVSGFRAALDLDTYPLRNLIRPRCAERAKPGRGKPVLIMYIGFFACFHAISLERSRFSKIAKLVFLDREVVQDPVKMSHLPQPVPVSVGMHCSSLQRLMTAVFTHQGKKLYLFHSCGRSVVSSNHSHVRTHPM